MKNMTSKMNGMKTAAMAMAVVALQTSAFADTTTATVTGQTTATESKSVLETLKEKAILNYWGYYRGAAINDPGNSFSPGDNGAVDASDTQSVENIVTAGYRIDKNWAAKVGAHFMYYPRGLQNADRADGIDGQQDIQMLDPIWTLDRANVINSNGLKLKLSLSGKAAMTENDFAKSNKMLGYASFIQNLTYDVPNTRLTLGMYSYIRQYVHGSETAANGRTHRFYVAPNANYQFTETVAGTFWMDMIYANRNRQTGFIEGFKNAGVEFQTGVNWDVTPYLSVNPMVNFKAANLQMDTTSFQALVTAKAF